MSNLPIPIPENLTPLEGIAVYLAWDSEGNQVLRYQVFGELSVWSRVALLEAAADKAREELKEKWE